MDNNLVELSQEEEKKWREIHHMESNTYKERCDYCNQPVYQIVKAPRELDVEIWSWTTTCWKCQKDTQIVWPNKELSGFMWESITPHSFTNLPEAIHKLYPSFKITEKRTMGVIEHGNTCSHCEAYQGDWFVIEDLLEVSYEPEIVEKCQIRIQLTDDEQLYYANPKKVLKMHSLRKGNYSSLCESCFDLHKKKMI
jgi:hypothetical protein